MKLRFSLHHQHSPPRGVFERTQTKTVGCRFNSGLPLQTRGGSLMAKPDVMMNDLLL
jgi:hypothetical protein